MPKFAVRKIEAVVGKQQFGKLVIDEVCPFDEFENNIEQQYKSELHGIYNYMNAVANLLSVPNTKFHFYDDGKDGVREFEFKSKNLRVYGITQAGGKLIILGGKKAKQKDDETEFRRLKDMYLADQKELRKKKS
jgi:hypothetical protein